MERLKVFIDPGHGGDDSGAVSLCGVKESDINLKVCLGIHNYLSNDVEVESHLIRTDDSFVALTQRVRMAKEGLADFFVSFHCNSRDKAGPKGLEPESYYSVLNNVDGFSGFLARMLHYWEIRRMRESGVLIADRGTKEANFLVLRAMDKPSALMEMGFMCDPEEVAILSDAMYQDILSKAFARAISHYAGILRYRYM